MIEREWATLQGAPEKKKVDLRAPLWRRPAPEAGYINMELHQMNGRPWPDRASLKREKPLWLFAITFENGPMPAGVKWTQDYSCRATYRDWCRNHRLDLGDIAAIEYDVPIPGWGVITTTKIEEQEPWG